MICSGIPDLTVPQPLSEGTCLIPAQGTPFNEGILTMIYQALPQIYPELSYCIRFCVSLLGICILVGFTDSFSGTHGKILRLSGTAAMSALFVSDAHSILMLGLETAKALSEYGKLLLPVFASALAFCGHTASSAAIYSGTILFLTVLSRILQNIMLPITGYYLAVAVCCAATGERILKSIKKAGKEWSTWILKTMLTVFTAYLGITGVVAGTTDAAALKAAKAAFSTFVPVVGGILSEASEAVLVSGSILKNTAGIYGIYAVLSIVILPFLRIGCQYCLLKLTGTVCTLFPNEYLNELMEDFASMLGMILAMISAESVLLLISCVCFLRITVS